jgi:metal-responsive CopG/Arc/MetJ family transcriptional regulator
MKVAVSIPDEVFEETETLVKRLKTSRSDIYSRALGEFLGRHSPNRVTETLNTTLQHVADKPDPFTVRSARQVLKRVEW